MAKRKLPILRSSQAENDVIGIWSRIAQDNLAAASATLRKIDKKIELLATHPFLGELQPQIAANIRRTTVGNYVVFYEVRDESILVMRIFHAARKWEDLI